MMEDNKKCVFRAGLAAFSGGRNGRRPPKCLLLMAASAAAFMAVPVIYIFIQSISADAPAWRQMLSGRIPQLLWNTGRLAFIVTSASAAIGSVLAFLVVRTDLPGFRHLRWLLALPLVFPPYVGALTYIIIFGPRGWLHGLTGWVPFPVYESLLSTSVVLTLFCYPYVYLIVMSSLRSLGAGYEETALACGLSYPQALRRVVFPMMRPAVGAGALLVALYVFSDFGAVAMLRYNTFVSSIYYQIQGRFDRTGAAMLSSVLILITLALLWLESWSRRGRRYSRSETGRRFGDEVMLGRLKIPAIAFTAGVFSLSVLIPLIVLIYWSIRGIGAGALSGRFGEYMVNSVVLAAVVSITCMIFSLPIVYLKSRFPSFISRMISGISFSGYALPGVIVALGIISFFHRFLPLVYATSVMLAAAHFMRFLPQGLAYGGASLARVSPNVDEAAQSLGASPHGTMLRVVFPLMLPGILTGGALVFVSSLKELPATLLLRPPGYDTLSVRVWNEAHEGFYEMAAPAALLIVLVAIPAVKLLLKGD